MTPREKALEAALKDAISGYHYILQQHGHVPGVGFSRVLDNARAALAMPSEPEQVEGGAS